MKPGEQYAVMISQPAELSAWHLTALLDIEICALFEIENAPQNMEYIFNVPGEGQYYSAGKFLT